MNSTTVSQPIFSAESTTVLHLILTAVTIATCLWLFRTLAHANVVTQRGTRGSLRQVYLIQDTIPSLRHGAHLRQVYPAEGCPEEGGHDAEVDIIAIHGLDTNSEKTWTWQDRKDPRRKVNWLKHPKMLPSKVKHVRIFTCDWPADLLQPSNLVQKTKEEFALLLLEDIRRELQLEKDYTITKDRPILFIASCLGGIILMNALVNAEENHPIRRATRGIIFLATPFRGTSFQDVATFAEPGLQTWRAIEESLWKKDILRLGTKIRDELLTRYDIRYSKMNKIETLVRNELSVLEGLAFNGLHNDVINFELEHWGAVAKKSESADEWIAWDTRLPRLSFLRTSELSELSEKDHNPGYHFLHLTFQEYFAARYFTRQWKDEQPLSCLHLSNGNLTEIEPAAFLQEYKYDPRYDIFWRFVAGLLDADGKASSFFQAIEEQSDLLGPTHQRLIMHCLSETEEKENSLSKLRAELEEQLSQWLLFECRKTQDCYLASEMECPERVLVNALDQASENERLILLESLRWREAV